MLNHWIPSRRIFSLLLCFLLVLVGLVSPASVKADYAPPPQEEPPWGGKKVRAAYLNFVTSAVTPVPATLDVSRAWLDPGCFAETMAIRVDEKGSLSGTCHTENDYMGTHYILTGSLQGTLTGTEIFFTAEIKQEFQGEGAIVYEGQTKGTFTQKGTTSATYVATGKLESPNQGVGQAAFEVSCQVSQYNEQGQVPYGVGGNCAGSTATNPDNRSDSGTAAGSVGWILNFEDITVRIPVIILPGIAGTQLLVGDDEGNELWPFAPLASRLYLALNEDGVTPADPDPIHKIAAGKILREDRISALNYYGGLIASLQEIGYTELGDLFILPYDWRLSNADHYKDLDHVLDGVRILTGEQKVILVAHSMGGVIARGYVYEKPEYAARVEAIITIGTPYWGAPKAYYALVNGYQFGNVTVNKRLMKILGQNWPSAYQLGPRVPFIYDTENKSMLSLEDSYKIQYQWFKGIGLTLRDIIAQNPTYLIDVEDHPADYENLMTPNAGLVAGANQFYARVGTKSDPKPLPSGIKQYAIIGVGVKTLGAFNMRSWTQDKDAGNFGVELPNGRVVVFEPDFYDGDGTVPLWSAETSAATTTYYVNHREGDGNSAGHGSLPANTTVQAIVSAILKDNPPKASLFPYPEVIKPGYTDLEPSLLSWATFNGYTTDFTLHSDAHLKITNPAGQVVGFNEEGVVDEGISGSSFLEMESGEYASIPHAGDALHVEVNGIQDGKFTLQVDVTTPAGKQATLLYPEVPVSAGTAASFDLPADLSAAALPPMAVTTGGTTTQVTPGLTEKENPTVTQLNPQAADSEIPLETGPSIIGGKAPSGEANKADQPTLPVIPMPGGSTLVIGAGVLGMFICAGTVIVFLLLLGFRTMRSPASRRPSPPPKGSARPPKALSSSESPALTWQGDRPGSPGPASAPAQILRANKLVIIRGNSSPQSLDLTPIRILIGSDPVTCSMVLVDPMVASQHAIVDYTAAEYVLTDLNSSTGTFINGYRIQCQALRPGDRIIIGQCELVVQ